MPIICEVKFVSPVEGRLRADSDVGEIATAYERAGAIAVSVITEPKHFGGDLDYLAEVKKRVNIPVLMKDVVIDSAQIEAAARLGADAVLLIEGIFERRLAGLHVDEMIQVAHSSGLEVVLEVHTEFEYQAAIETKADIVGINNRNLESLDVSLETSRRILTRYPRPKPVVSESGLKSREDLLALRSLGADAFLVGSALMKSPDPSAVIRAMLEE
jgi:indole-3-glycerol phosphate synthase